MESSALPNIPEILTLEGISLGSTFGVGYLGLAISSIFYGVTCCQTINYYRSRKARTDDLFLKSMVALCWVLDSTHQALIIHLFYDYLILNFGNPVVLGTIVWCLPLQLLLNIIIAFFVQIFLVSRIWRLGRDVRVTAFCGFLVVAALGIYLYYPIKLYMFNDLETAENALQPKAIAGLSAAITADIAIAIATTCYLYRSRTGFQKFDGIITRLIALTVTTGILTTSVEIVIFILLLVDKRTFWDLSIGFVVSKMYANTFLIILNTRDLIRGGREHEDTESATSESISQDLADFSHDKAYGRAHTPIMGVVVTRTVETSSDIIDMTSKYAYEPHAL